MNQMVDVRISSTIFTKNHDKARKKSMFKKIIIIIIIAVEGILLNSIAQTQEPDAQNTSKESRYYFMIGWGQLDIKSHNSRITSKGYTQLSDNFFSIGGGGKSKNEL
jgi:hypothetical protein